MIKLLWRESPTLLGLSVLASIATSVLMLGVLAILASYVANPGARQVAWWEFLLLTLVTVLCQILATIGIGALSQRVVRHLRCNLVARLAAAPLIRLEESGSAPLQAALVEDAMRIAEALPGIVALARDYSFIVACFFYLAWLSLKMTGVMLAVIGVSVLIYYPLQSHAIKLLQLLRSRYQQLFTVFRNIVDGTKQLKMNGRQLRDVMDNVQHQELAIGALTTRSLVSFAAANAFAVLIFLALIEVMIFGGFAEFLERRLIAAYTLTLIFLLTPLQAVTSAAQLLGRARTALGRIRDLEARVTDLAEEVASAGTDGGDVRSTCTDWQKLEICNVRHAYRTSSRERFEIGPVSLTLRPGQLVLIVGGNGSGKTTLAKLLAGLYAPEAGAIKLDGVAIDDTNRSWYRRHIGAVFADVCLFDGLADSSQERFARDMPALVQQLKLDQVLHPDKGVFAQAASFSTGERKRVALLLACLEDPPIYIFDEFAADQDPDSKELFYRKILRDLRRRGKLLIVITHDTRYFDEADCVLVLERGVPPVLQSHQFGLTAS